MTATPMTPPRRKRRRRSLRTRLNTVMELTRAFRGTGRWWLLPMVGIFLVSAVVLAIVHLVQYAAPFVYTIF